MMPDEFLAQRLAQMEAAEAAQERATNSGWWKFPMFLVAAPLASAFIYFFIEPGEQAMRVRREQLDQKHLECRMLGGSWEYFGSQGWQCIPEVKR